MLDDAFTMVADLDEPTAIQGPVEEAVLDLIGGTSERKSEGLERVAA